MPNEAKTHWLERMPFWVILCVGFLLIVLHYSRALVCVFLAMHYWNAGNVDLFAVWLVLAVLSVPDRKWYEPRTPPSK